MNQLYAKTVLYAFPVMENVIEQIDELVDKRALGSMDDFSPCLSQCERIVELINQKQRTIDLKLTVDGIVIKFTPFDMMHFEYKFFKRKPKEFFSGFDTSSRKYFRKQISLIKKFSEYLEKKGIDDAVFERDYLSIEFFKELYLRVVEKEEKSVKNVKKREEKAA